MPKIPDKGHLEYFISIGYSQSDLAKILKVSRQAIHQRLNEYPRYGNKPEKLGPRAARWKKNSELLVKILDVLGATRSDISNVTGYSKTSVGKIINNERRHRNT